jgi:hypothetical protein
MPIKTPTLLQLADKPTGADILNNVCQLIARYQIQDFMRHGKSISVSAPPKSSLSRKT